MDEAINNVQQIKDIADNMTSEHGISSSEVSGGLTSFKDIMTSSSSPSSSPINIEKEEEKEDFKANKEKTNLNYSDYTVTLSGAPPPPPPQQVAMTPYALELMEFPECESEHPDCFGATDDDETPEKRRRSFFTSANFLRFGSKSSSTTTPRSRNQTASNVTSGQSQGGGQSEGVGSAINDDEIAEMFGFVEAPAALLPKVPLPSQEDMIARALGAASGYGEDLLLRQQENFAKKVQNRSRTLVENDFENMWTRRIPVFPAAPAASSSAQTQSAAPQANNKQRPHSIPNSALKTMSFGRSNSSKEQAVVDSAKPTAPSGGNAVDLNKEDKEEKGDLKQNIGTEVNERQNSRKVGFTSLGGSNSGSFEEKHDFTDGKNTPTNSSPPPPIPTESDKSQTVPVKKQLMKRTSDRSKSHSGIPSAASSSQSNGTSERQSNSSSGGGGLEIVVHNLAPEAFRAVRKTFGFSFRKFAASLGAAPLITVGNGGGRSGARFFLSHDKKFVVKSIILEEVNVLLGVLPDYLDHVISNSIHTLLPRFLGLFRVEIPGVKTPIDLIVMPNLFRVKPKAGVTLEQCYDLKGCFYKGRYEKPDEKQPLKVLKDRNFCPHHVGKKDAFRFPTNSGGSFSSHHSNSATSAIISNPMPSNNTGGYLVNTGNSIDMLNCSGHGSRRRGMVEKSNDDPPDSSEDTAAAAGLSKESGSFNADDSTHSNGSAGSGGAGGAGGAGMVLPPGFIDMDFDELEQDQSNGDHLQHEVLRLGYDRKAVFISNLRNDTHWLQEHGLMDYSMLLAVGKCSVEKVMHEKRIRKAMEEALEAQQNKVFASRTSAQSAFRYGVPSAQEQTEGELKYLLSHRAPLDSEETERVKQLMKESMISKEDKEAEEEKKRQEKLEAKKIAAATRRASLQYLQNQEDGDSSDDDENGNPKVKRNVSYWEAESGGVSAACEETNMRLTISDVSDVFDLGFKSASSSHREKDILLKKQASIKKGALDGKAATEGGDPATAAASSLVEESASDAQEEDQEDDIDEDEREWYRFGLIDILQTWNMRKRAENIAKVTMMGVDPNAVSSINPKKYADRMTAFFETHTT